MIRIRRCGVEVLFLGISIAVTGDDSVWRPVLCRGVCGKLVIGGWHGFWIVLGFGRWEVYGCEKLGGNGIASALISGMVVVGYLNGGKMLIHAGWEREGG